MSILDDLYKSVPQTPINQAIAQTANLRNILQSVGNSSNPLGMINAMAQSNPKLREVLPQANQYVAQNGNNYETAVLNYMRQNGIDINTLLQALGRK